MVRKLAVVTLVDKNDNMVHLVKSSEGSNDVQSMVPIVHTGSGIDLGASASKVDTATKGNLEVRYASTFIGTPQELADSLKRAGDLPWSDELENPALMQRAGMTVRETRRVTLTDAAKVKLVGTVKAGTTVSKGSICAIEGVQLFHMFHAFSKDGGIDNGEWARLGWESGSFIRGTVKSIGKDVLKEVIHSEVTDFFAGGADATEDPLPCVEVMQEGGAAVGEMLQETGASVGEVLLESGEAVVPVAEVIVGFIFGALSG